MSLKIRRGTNAHRTGVTFDMGELVWTTDTKKLYVGNGLDQGGESVVKSSVGVGLQWNEVLQTVELNQGNINTDNITQGINNKFFAKELAQDAAWELFRDGTHSNITFTYNDTLNTISATVAADQVGITSVQQDTAPDLGGDLNLNSFNITGVGDIDTTGNITASGTITADVLAPNKIVTVGGYVDIGSTTQPQTLTIYSPIPPQSSTNIVLRSVASGPQAGPSIEYKANRGTHAVPTTLQTSDALGLNTYFGYNGSTHKLASLVGSIVDPNGSLSGGNIPGLFLIGTLSDGNPNNAKATTINRNGYLAVGHPYTYDAVAHVDINGAMKLQPLGTAPSSPSSGTLAVANGTGWNPTATGKPTLVCYLGSTWVQVAVAP